MTPFDASIVAVALPAMGGHLQLSYSQGLWAQAAYLLVTSVLLIPAGRLADSRGLVRYYLLGTAVFALGSVVAALSPNGSVMIARALRTRSGRGLHVRHLGSHRDGCVPGPGAWEGFGPEHHGRLPRADAGPRARRADRDARRLALDILHQRAHRGGDSGGGVDLHRGRAARPPERGDLPAVPADRLHRDDPSRARRWWPSSCR